MDNLDVLVGILNNITTTVGRISKKTSRYKTHHILIITKILNRVGLSSGDAMIGLAYLQKSFVSMTQKDTMQLSLIQNLPTKKGN